MANPADDATSPAMRNMAMVLSFSSDCGKPLVLFGEVAISCIFIHFDGSKEFFFENQVLGFVSHCFVTLVDMVQWYEDIFCRVILF